MVRCMSAGGCHDHGLQLLLAWHEHGGLPVIQDMAASQAAALGVRDSTPCMLICFATYTVNSMHIDSPAYHGHRVTHTQGLGRKP